VGVDTSLLIYFIQPNGEKPRTRKLKIVGIYKTGIEVYDNVFALGYLKLIRRMNDWKPNDIVGYEIFIRDYPKMDQVSESIFNALPQQWNSLTMREIYPQIFAWLNLQNLNKRVILGIMIVVAIINLITCLIILVLERTRMVGVLKSLGAKNSTIQAIFCFRRNVYLLARNFLGPCTGVGDLSFAIEDRVHHTQ
jgi:lipoprotein-releasing system permease protein